MSYEKIVQYYDYIFPLQPVTLAFLQGSFAPDGRILDVGCGSGEYTTGLAQAGFCLDGLDLDPQMIATAGSKATDAGVQIAFTLGSMTELSRYYVAGTFDGMFCIGNSLAHVADHAQLLEVCRQLQTLLRPGGTLVLQVINYDRIISHHLAGLPTIENREHNLQFERHYTINFPEVRFTTVLRVDGESEISEIRLYALLPDELLETLHVTGFQNIETYGSFAGRPFERDQSQPLIVRCQA